MSSLLNTGRPPVFCPGCSHDRITHALDKAFSNLGFQGEDVVIVTDIGCSGLFDTFFNTHAFHGLHGRALTYATGLKLAHPELNVVVTMGDGGLGIGGAHILSACRRNLDLTLLVLNNFNFGMTGGQFSSTTAPDAHVGSGFLNRMERPMDVCQVASSAGAAYVKRFSTYAKNLVEEIESAIRFDGFSILDIWGICPGRFTKRNRLTPKIIDEALNKMPSIPNPVPENLRKEYGTHYRELAAGQKPFQRPKTVERRFTPPEVGRKDIIIMGSAGQRIITAGEILCLAGLFAGLQTTQKNEYNITVLRGHSITEVILSPGDIGYTGITRPDVVLAVSQEGVDRQRHIFDDLDHRSLIIASSEIDLPSCKAEVRPIDFKALKIKSHERALASLGGLASLRRVIDLDMLGAALEHRFRGTVLAAAQGLVEKVEID